MSADDIDPPRVWITDFDADAVRRLHESIEIAEDVLPVFIMSGGGGLYEMFAMIDIIRAARLPVATIAVGRVSSAATDLLAAGTKGHRWIAPSATVMVHDSGCSVNYRKSHEFQAYAEQNKRERDLSFDLFAKHTGKTRKFWDRWLAKRMNVDSYISPSEAVSLGIADHIGMPRISVDAPRKVKIA